MLEDLKILNGSISPDFKSNVYEYEVVVDNTTFSLLINYQISNDKTIVIYGNDNLTEGQNHVLIEICDGKTVETYTLNVFKEETKSAASYEEFDSIEVPIENTLLKDITTPGIFGIGFLIIIILFCIIFKRKTNE